jgi:hypothetical protein
LICARVEINHYGYQAPFSYGSGGVNEHRGPHLDHRERVVTRSANQNRRLRIRILIAAGFVDEGLRPCSHLLRLA